MEQEVHQTISAHDERNKERRRITSVVTSVFVARLMVSAIFQTIDLPSYSAEDLIFVRTRMDVLVVVPCDYL